jgi:predicted permease
MKDYKDIAMYVLGALIVGGFFFILYVVFSKALPEDNREIGLLVIGALIAKFGDVVNYFYGSSKGSAEKNELLHKKLKE